MKKHIIIILVCIIVAGVFTRVYLGFQKVYFHMDEAYSYGLMNYDKLSIVDNEDFLNTWHNKEYYLDYFEVNNDEVFDFKPVWENQINDVHPPLYYFLLRIAATFTVDNFTKWTGIILNIIFFIISTIFVYLIGRRLFKSPYYALLLCFVNTFAGIGLNSVLYIRMYELSNLNILIITYLHIKLYQNKNNRIRDYLILIPSLILGGMTHYYYFVYVIGVYIVFSWFCIRNKRYKDLKMYNGVCILAAVIYLVIWPYSLHHILNGDRGIEQNVGIHQLYTNLAEFLWIANKEFFYYLLPFLIILVVIISHWKVKKRKNVKSNNEIKFLIVPVILYFILISKNAPYLEIRYLIPIYSVTIIIVIYYIKIYLKKFWSNKDTLFIESFMFLIMCYIPFLIDKNFEFCYSGYNNIVESVEEKKLPMVYVFNTDNNRFLDDIYLFTLSDKSIVLDYKDVETDEFRNLLEEEKHFILICNEGVQKEKFEQNFETAEYLQRLNAADVYEVQLKNN